MRQRVFAVTTSLLLVALAVAALPVASTKAPGLASVVSSTADSGPGTLREALERATPGTTITFDPAIFPPNSPATIRVTSALPDLLQGHVTIDARSAGVILDGSQLPRGERPSGLHITSNGNAVRGLHIMYFPGNGVGITQGAQENVIGGATAEEGNVISRNYDGVTIAGSGTMYNTVSGNYIGTDATGTTALGNERDGVWIGEGAQYNTVGGATSGERNVISGNGASGVVIDGSGTMYNSVSGNYIGTDNSGTAAIGNGVIGVVLAWGAQHNLIGGSTPGARNLISGNESSGVYIANSGTEYNTVSGNHIGTDVSGAAAIPNGNFGVDLADGAQNNTIGGSTAAEGNLISGNRKGGINMAGPGVMHNIASGNYVGTDATGTTAIGNEGWGIIVGDGAQYNRIGGEGSGERNIISGNRGDEADGVRIARSGTDRNLVIGNYIGTDVTGRAALGNSMRGVFILEGAQYNVVSNNVISGNGNDGVPIEGQGTMFNTVSDNYIGTDSSGTAAIGNLGDGVFVAFGAQYNLFADNLISGNRNNGVQLRASGTMHNTLSGNYVGTDVTGEAAIGNLGSGIAVADSAGPNTIGPDNVIAFNGGPGVAVDGDDTLGNGVRGNLIYQNEGLGIKNSSGGNAELEPPVITYVSARVVRGTALPGSTVDIFSDEEDQGRVLEGSTVADEEGNFTFRLSVGRFTGRNVTATATDEAGNTSQFSSPATPPAPRVMRELPGIVSPTQVSVEPKVLGTNLGLALFCVVFFGLTSTVFNRILRDFRDELLGAFRRLVPRRLAGLPGRVGAALGGVRERGWGALLAIWLVVLMATSLIESFLDPQVGVLSVERLGVWLTLFVAAVTVGGLELGSDLAARRRLAPALRVEARVQWIGIAAAVGCVILSRALDFRPGYLYGFVGAAYLLPKVGGVANSGKRAVLVLGAVLGGVLLLWLVTAFLPAALAELEPLLLTTFLIGLQGVFFELLPLAVTEGGDIWNWRRAVWFVCFLAVFFCFYHFVLNPNASDVQALQQNGVQTVLILIVVFGLGTLILWLLFPLRLGREKR